jgi:sugar/nucleoside kinase (ribokinase family)
MGTLLTVVGDLVEDVVVWARGEVRRGTDNAATVHRVRGGSAANVATAAAAAGAATRFIGRVGDDDAGARLVESLGAAGVDVRAQRAGRTGSVVVLVDPSGERTMFPDRAASAELGAIDREWLVGTTCLHVPAYGLTVEPAATSIVAAVGVAHAIGAEVSVDVSAASLVDEMGAPRFHAVLDALRPRLVFANAAEAAALGLGGRPQVAGRTYVVKDGGRAARVVHDDGRVESIAPTPLDHPADTTGAGDAFAGGFLASWLRVPDAAAAVRAGHRLAALVLSSPGATLSHRAEHADVVD